MPRRSEAGESIGSEGFGRAGSHQQLAHSAWRREAGRFTLIVAPGVLDERRRDIPRRVGPHEASDLYVGVPFGPKARLILIYLQTEGRKSRVVNMGRSMSA
jgi:hypothetical protein